MENTEEAGLRGEVGNCGSSEQQLVHYRTTRAIIGCLFEVHRELGAGFLENVYLNAVSILLRERGLAVRREVPFDVMFHGEVVGRYRADMIVDGKVIVEVKTARAIESAHIAQVTNYLRAANLRIGLILNFGAKADFKRVAFGLSSSG